jgi:hypothetical protein
MAGTEAPSARITDARTAIGAIVPKRIAITAAAGIIRAITGMGADTATTDSATAIDGA